MIQEAVLSSKSSGKYFRLYAYSFIISFTGSLPIGTLNVSITDMVVNRGARAAVLFGLGAILVEVSMVRIALVAIKRLEGMSHIMRWLRAFACAVILLLAFISLKAALNIQKPDPGISFSGHAPFICGMVLSLLNPLHLPFWMGWTAVLKGKGVLADRRHDYNVYVMAIGMGTAIAFAAYGLVGHLLIMFLRVNQNLFNGLAGGALLVTGIFQCWKLINEFRRVLFKFQRQGDEV